MGTKIKISLRNLTVEEKLEVKDLLFQFIYNKTKILDAKYSMALAHQMTKKIDSEISFKVAVSENLKKNQMPQNKNKL